MSAEPERSRPSMFRRLFTLLRRPSLCEYGTNALISELAERGDLALAVGAYRRLYGVPECDCRVEERG